jgi:uncharacterized membrane protein
MDYQSNPNPNPEVTNDDRLLAALDYVFSPLVPIIILLMEDKKNRPFLRAHTVQALVLGIIVWILQVVIGTVTCGLGFLLWLVMLYYGYQAYQGKYINIPVITDFVKNQGWA